MLRNYLRTALRNLWKYKFYSFLNILGLAIGLTCFLFILVYVKDELSYDRFHEKADRIYRLNFTANFFEQDLRLPKVGDPYGPFLVETLPEVEEQVRFRDRGGFLMKYENKTFREDRVIYADSSLFDVFSLPLVEGDPATALAEPFTMVISPAIAKKYFGSENPIGKSLELDNRVNYRVTAVMEPIPHNSHFNFDCFLSMSTLERSRANEWLSANFNTYVVLNENTAPRDVEAKFPTLFKEHIGGEVQKYVGITYEDFIEQGNQVHFSLMPMTKIHLHSDLSDELGVNSDVRYVYIFSAIGLFILLLACINFMNLSTARSANRAKEVGLRKVVGADRTHLIAQFLSESLVLTAVSLGIAGILIWLLMPYFNEMAGKNLSLRDINHPWLWVSMMALIGGVGLLAGSYPAFFLSAFRPIQTLKGKLSVGARNSLFRNALVVFQFAITIILIIGSLVVYDQLSYIQNKKLGFEKDQLLILNDAYALQNNLWPFKEEMKRQTEVINATVSGFLPTPSNRNTNATFLGRNPDASNTQVLAHFSVDFDYITTLGMEVLEGRPFKPEFPTDSSAVMLNEAAADIFGIADDPLGKEIGTWGNSDGEYVVYEVIGVVKDFHFESLRQKIGPLCMFISRSSSNMTLRVSTDNLPRFLAKLENKWNEYAPGQPFDYEFMDEAFNQVYAAETRIGGIIRLFTILAIFVACLGLLGLATYTTEQRTKEIGIRKVLGAPMGRIYLLLTSEFAKWVVAANAIALPVGYLVMRRWLQGFEYQSGIGWSTILFAALLGITIAILTVSYHAIRAARVNPVESLKYE